MAAPERSVTGHRPHVDVRAGRTDTADATHIRHPLRVRIIGTDTEQPVSEVHDARSRSRPSPPTPRAGAERPRRVPTVHPARSADGTPTVRGRGPVGVGASRPECRGDSRSVRAGTRAFTRSVGPPVTSSCGTELQGRALRSPTAAGRVVSSGECPYGRTHIGEQLREPLRLGRDHRRPRRTRVPCPARPLGPVIIRAFL